MGCFVALTRDPYKSPFYIGRTLSNDKACSNLDTGIDFVSISAGFTSVLIFSTLTCPFSMISLTKCKRTSMCLVLSEKYYFYLNVLHFVSHKKILGIELTIPNSLEIP